MDNIWIVLLIVGAVISLSQKSRKQHPQQESQDEDPARELRKQFEEMFGRRDEHPAAPRPTATPVSIPKAMPAQTEAEPHTASSPYSVAEATVASRRTELPETHKSNTADKFVRDTSHRNKSLSQNSVRRQQQTKKSDAAPQPHAASTSAAANQNDSDIGRIIEEFDMERAVIYSEILKPKYEEY